MFKSKLLSVVTISSLLFSVNVNASEARSESESGSDLTSDKNKTSSFQRITKEQMQLEGYSNVKEAVDHLLKLNSQLDDLNYATFIPAEYKFSRNSSDEYRREVILLINGIRFPETTFSSQGHRNRSVWKTIYDEIPSAAIRYIEYKDGFSGSIYGRDGIQGVVNIVLEDSLDYSELYTAIYKAQHKSGLSRHDVEYTTGFSKGKLSGILSLYNYKSYGYDLQTSSIAPKSGVASDINPQVQGSHYGIGYEDGSTKFDSTNPLDVDKCKQLAGPHAIVFDKKCGFNRSADLAMYGTSLDNAVLMHGAYDWSDRIKARTLFLYSEHDYSSKKLPLLLSNGDIKRRLYEFTGNHTKNNEKNIDFSLSLNGLHQGFHWKTGVSYAHQRRLVNNFDTVSTFSQQMANLLKTTSPLAKSDVDELVVRNDYDIVYTHFSWATEISKSLFETMSGVSKLSMYSELGQVRSHRYISSTISQARMKGDTKIFERMEGHVGAKWSIPLSTKVHTAFTAGYSNYGDLDNPGPKVAVGAQLAFKPISSLTFGLNVNDSYSPGNFPMTTSVHQYTNYGLTMLWRPQSYFYFSSAVYQLSETVDSAETTTRKLLFRLYYRSPSFKFGQFKLSLSGAYLLDKDVVKNHIPTISSIYKKHRLTHYNPNVQITWDYKKWRTTLNTYYTGSKCSWSSVSSDCLDNSGKVQKIKHHTYFNLYGGYQYSKNLYLKANVYNVLDTKPIFEPTVVNTKPPYIASGSARGREFMLGFTYAF